MIPAELGPSADPRPRRHGAWSRRCPSCLSLAALSPAPRGALQCEACEAVLAPPGREAELPAWETAPELAEAWDAYSRPGRLLEDWGRSTDRQDGGPPPGGEEAEHMAPRVRTPWIRGRQDVLLEAAVKQYVDHTEGLRDAVDALKRLALRVGQASVEEPARPRRKPSSASSEAPEMSHRRPRRAEYSGGVTETPGSFRQTSEPPEPSPDGSADVDDVVDVDAHLFRDGRDERQRDVRGLDVAVDDAPDASTPPWYARLFNAGRLATLSQYAALYLLVTNALKKRGVEVDDTLDLIHPRTRRATPFAGLRHAMAAAYGLEEPAEASPLPRNALAKFKLPSGVVFGKIACRPTRNHPATAREPRSDRYDLEDAIDAARVGARTYCDAGRIRREPGRPLLDWERELVRLVDAGEERKVAHRSQRTQKIDRLAVERLSLEEALPKLRGFEGAPHTLKEAKIALQAARRAIRLALEDRALIPSAGAPVVDVLDEGSSPATAAGQVTAPRSKRRTTRAPRPEAFAGVGAPA